MRARPGLPATHAQASLPAPIGGLNTVTPAAAMPPTEALQLFNLTPSEYGLRSRLGSREWVTGLGDDGDPDALPPIPPTPPVLNFRDFEVRTIIPFTGATVGDNRLFAANQHGIWNVSASTFAPTLAIAFPSTANQAGRGISHVAVTAGGHFLLYTDEENGLYIYPAGGPWAKAVAGVAPGEINGANPDNFVFCTVWKGRTFYVERNTARAWYTLPGTITGAVAAFDFAQRFRAGGPLVGLWHWSYDGGAGMDDSLVVVSGGGDVAIYQGTDIGSSTNFGLKGVWTLGGAPPAGRRIALDSGGDLLLLSRIGIVPISQLVTGSSRGVEYTTAKIANLFNAAMLTRAELPGWSLRIHPEDNCLLVTVPVASGAPTEQMAMSLPNQGWSRYRGLPMTCTEVWEGKLYFGTHDGRVLVNDGYLDGITLAEADAFMPVEWAVLTSFQSMGDGRQKHVELLRPSFLGQEKVSAYRVEARYRYNFAEAAPPTGTTGGGGGSGTWDDPGTVWDDALWATEYTSTQDVRGATGIGVEVAVAMRGQAVVRTIVVGWDVLYSSGGWL